MEGCIEVTGIDVRRLVASVYAESEAVGYGVLHFEPGPLPDRELDRIVGHMRIQGEGCCLSLDYVKGRAVKFHLFRDGQDRLWVRRTWFDHSEMQLFRALRNAGWKEVRSELT